MAKHNINIQDGYLFQSLKEGQTMYLELVTGRKPFNAENAMDMFMQHVSGPFERPSRLVLDLPVWLDNLICQLLEKKPDQRPFNAATVSELAQVDDQDIDNALTTMNGPSDYLAQFKERGAGCPRPLAWVALAKARGQPAAGHRGTAAVLAAGRRGRGPHRGGGHLQRGRAAVRRDRDHRRHDRQRHAAPAVQHRRT